MQKYSLPIIAATLALAMPAHAGPILDEISGPALAWTSAQESESNGIETYSGLRLQGSGDNITFISLKLSRANDMISAEFEGMDIMAGTESENETFYVKAGVLEADPRLFRLGASGIDRVIDNYIMADPSETPECSELDMSFRISMSDVRFNGDAPLLFETLDINHAIQDPKGDCILDMDMTTTGIRMNIDEMMDFYISRFESDIYSTLLDMKPPENPESAYTANFTLTDMNIAVQGQEQFRVDEISFESSMDPSSLAGMIDSGYFSIYNDMINGISDENSESKPDFSNFSLPAMWNGIGNIISNGNLLVKGAIITGDMPGQMSGQLFANGRKLDMSAIYDQKKSDVMTELTISSPGLFDFNLELDMVLDEIGSDFKGAEPGDLLALAPASLRSMSIRIEDEAFGDIIEQEMGFSPYLMTGFFLVDFLEADEAAKFDEWLARAQTGGTSFSANPNNPIPLMQIFEGFMGNWASLGTMLNTTVGK